MTSEPQRLAIQRQWEGEDGPSTRGLCGEARSIPRAFGSCERHQKGSSMAATQPEGQATVIAVYPDHASAEEAVRRLHKEGIPMQNLSIIGKDFQLVVK